MLWSNVAILRNEAVMTALALRRAYSTASSVFPVPAAPSKRQRGLSSSSSSRSYCSSVRLSSLSSARPMRTDIASTR